MLGNVTVIISPLSGRTDCESHDIYEDELIEDKDNHLLLDGKYIKRIGTEGKNIKCMWMLCPKNNSKMQSFLVSASGNQSVHTFEGMCTSS